MNSERREGGDGEELAIRPDGMNVLITIHDKEDLLHWLRSEIETFESLGPKAEGLLPVRGVIRDLTGLVEKVRDGAELGESVAHLNVLYRDLKLVNSNVVRALDRSLLGVQETEQAFARLLRGRGKAKEFTNDEGSLWAMVYELGPFTATPAARTLSDLERQRAQADQFLKSVADEWKTKIESYSAATALKAPRDYWQAKGKSHNDRARQARRNFLGSLVAALCVIVSLAIYSVRDFTPPPNTTASKQVSSGQAVGQQANSQPADNYAGALLLLRQVLIFASVLALTVWGVRQLLRIWIMHEHLEEDARERVAMIDTYAALKGMGMDLHAESPIVQALYRTATTGLVKEDAGPATPFEVVLKSFAEAAQKTR